MLHQESYSYIRGHCGWDSVTLLFGEDIPQGEEHRIARTLFEPPCSGASEVGFLYPPEEKEDIRLRIIDSTTKTWLPMCGGMSQVIGLAAFTTPIRERFKIEKRTPISRINLRTDSGMIPVETLFKGDRVSRVVTHMPEYAGYLYSQGVGPVAVRGIPAMKVGYFLVFKMDDLKKASPDLEFGHRRPGPGLDFLGEIQSEYLREYVRPQNTEETLYSMIYDLHPEVGGDARIYTRFYRGRGVPQATPYETQCGTGTVAVGIAMAERGELPLKGRRGGVVFEWGSFHLTRDPYGGRKSILEVEMEGSRIAWAAFSHNIVEIQSIGTVFLPAFERSLF